VTGNQALHLIADPWLSKGWGFRHLWIGYSGSGKTFANAQLAAYTVKQGIVTISVDQKSKISRYSANCIDTEDALAEFKGRSCVIRGFASRGRMADRVDFNSLAKMVWVLAKSGLRVALMVDELSDAQKSERHFDRPAGTYPWMETLYRQGREMGISLGVATQLPQEIPRCAYSLSDSVAFFRQEAHESEYYRRVGIMSDEDIAYVAALPQWAFMLWRRGDPKRYVGVFKP